MGSVWMDGECFCREMRGGGECVEEERMIAD